MEKEIINKLFLELSQVATAETKKEREYKHALQRVIDITPLDHPARKAAIEALKRVEYTS